jgi:hypothetical protein
MTAVTERRKPTHKTPAEHARSSEIHRAVLDFNAASKLFGGSTTLMAIYVSLAYRDQAHTLSLGEISTAIRSDQRTINNITTLARIGHERSAIRLRDGWEADVPRVIGTVFSYAERFMHLDRETLEPFYRYYPDIFEDIQKPIGQRKELDIELRRVLIDTINTP